MFLQMENGEDNAIKEEQLDEQDLEEMVMARTSKMAIVNEKVNLTNSKFNISYDWEIISNY
jgi:hypothetical protein